MNKKKISTLRELIITVKALRAESKLHARRISVLKQCDKMLDLHNNYRQYDFNWQETVDVYEGLRKDVMRALHND